MIGTRHDVVRKTIGGVTFDDAYAWLQPDSDETLTWQRARDAEARGYARSRPAFEPLLERLLTDAMLSGSSAGRRVRGGRWFWTGNVEGRHALFVAPGADAPGSVLVNARDLDLDDSSRTEIGAFEPSPDGSHVAFTLSRHGEMIGCYAIVRTADARIVAGETEVKLYLGSAPDWAPESDAFYWGDRDHEAAHVVRKTTLDGATATVVRFDADIVPERYPALQMQVSPDGRWLLGSGTPHDRRAIVLGDLQTGAWRPFLPEAHPGECNGVWSDPDTYVAIVTHDAPRGRIVAIPTATSQNATTWRPLVSQAHANLRSLAIAQDRIVACAIVDACARYFVYRMDGTPAGEIPLPPFGFSPDASPPRRIAPSDRMLVSFGSFTSSLSQYLYDAETGRLTLAGPPPFVVSNVSVEQRFVTSTGGARPTYFVLRRSDLPDGGPRPAVITAYGGFNLAWMPKFVGMTLPLVEAGGVYVHAVLRGGGEYGQAWYDDGRGVNKQHTYDDLYAVAEDLIGRGVTTPERLAFKGDSNGGLTAGVAVVQRPDLWRVVVPNKPLLDMLEPAQQDGSMMSYFMHDFGDPEDPSFAPILAGFSPVHNVMHGVNYPAVFAVFGENDSGCRPYHGRRFVARLRDADPHGRPHHLRVWRDVGHGARDQRLIAEQEAEWLAVVMSELGLELHRPQPP